MKGRCRSHTRLHQSCCPPQRTYTRLLVSGFGNRLYQPQWQRASRRQTTRNLCIQSVYPLQCMNFLHHRLRLYQPSQNHQKGVTDIRADRGRMWEYHGPSRGSPGGTTMSAMVHRGGTSPSLNTERSRGQSGAEVLQTSAPMFLLAWWQAGSCDMPSKRPHNSFAVRRASTR